VPATTSSDSSAGHVAAAMARSDRTQRLGGRVRRALGNFAGDAGAIVAAPFHMRGVDYLWLGAALGAGAVLYANDEPIENALIRNRETPGLRTVLDVGDKLAPIGFMGRTNPFYAAALGAGYAFDVRPLRTVPTEILESHLLAGGVRNLGKILVGRKHPYENQGAHAFQFGKGTSFPSGHTSVVFELATIATMNTHSLPVGIAAYGLATTVALQRVASRNHWPSDVFVAGMYGTLVARTVVRLHEVREGGNATLGVAPRVMDDGALGVEVYRKF